MKYLHPHRKNPNKITNKAPKVLRAPKAPKVTKVPKVPKVLRVLKDFRDLRDFIDLNSVLFEEEFFAVADVDVAGHWVVDADALEVVDGTVAGVAEVGFVEFNLGYG